MNVLQHQTQIRELKKRQGPRTTSAPLYFAPYSRMATHVRKTKRKMDEKEMEYPEYEALVHRYTRSYGYTIRREFRGITM